MPRKIGSLTLYSVDDLHELLGISKMTLRAYLREGRLKGRKLGVQWFVTEEAIRDYFDQGQKENEQRQEPAKKEKKIKYVVQGVNDLVSETEECSTLTETLDCLHSQAIISLFQVQITDADTGEILEIVKARDFIDRYEE
ncbi:MAG: helix-turn-helix domain-containing protein [Balneolaceae bacterium]|jgi:excisionase family DNA binding protein|nr:helix-turn-helix domain-containing protein [Balneolaceae bacterium]